MISKVMDSTKVWEHLRLLVGDFIGLLEGDFYFVVVVKCCQL